MADEKNEGASSSPEATGAGSEKTERTRPHGIPVFEPLSSSKIGKSIAVMSGKGGVGKSAVTTLMAAYLRRQGYEVGILDTDVTGPSIPKGLGIKGPLLQGELGVLPQTTRTGIKVVSMNLILPSDEEAVIWRGPLVSSAIRQFYEETEWGTLDYLLLDLPPGTADVPLTVMQSISLDGVVLVTSPQELVGMIVGKALSMAKALDAPVLGVIENMSYAVCSECGAKIDIFGPSHADEVQQKTGIRLLGRIPLDPEISRLADEGRLEDYRSDLADEVFSETVAAAG